MSCVCFRLYTPVPPEAGRGSGLMDRLLSLNGRDNKRDKMPRDRGCGNALQDSDRSLLIDPDEPCF